ncbi:MAG: hypothetical protein LBK99_06795 [Opitutaceae bacterium]|jgi:hypothetical protein|nr:hypothetical protein [Opitutaceae bacterium]
MNDPQQPSRPPQYSGPCATASTGFPESANPNLILAVIAGCAAALIGALVWAGVAYATGYRIGWMAVGIGFLVGFAVRFGRGDSETYNLIGAVLALLGCMAGNAFMVVAYLANATDRGVFEVFSEVGVGGTLELMKLTFVPVDLLFYGIATYEGWHFATRPEPGEDG